MNFTEDLLAFLDESPTAPHAAEQAARRLRENGFHELREADPWDLQSGDCFLVRRGGALVAGIVGAVPPVDAGFRLVGTHTDVPALRLKPNAAYEKEGVRQLGVEVYGGAILATWADRDLALAGTVIVRRAPAIARELVRLRGPLCRVANVAVHLNRKVNDDGLKLDRQKHLPALCGLADGKQTTDAALRRRLADALGAAPEDIVDFSLDLVDAQPPCRGGLGDELIFARGIDNLVSCHAAVQALLDRRDSRPDVTAVIALFDNEEVGSETARGAGSTVLEAVLERLCLDGERPREDLRRALARSVLVSADGAHAVHPNYADLHDPQHKPRLGGGPVIKVNAGERYATTVETRAYLRACGEAAGVPLQTFVQRTDLPCGTTIGPIAATGLGVATADVGAPMLAMHSIRETVAAADCEALAKLLAAHLAGDVPLVV